AARTRKSPPADHLFSPPEARDIRSDSYRKLSSEQQRNRTPEGIGHAQRVLDFDLKPLAALEDDVVDTQSLKKRNGMTTDACIKKTIALIRKTTEESGDQEDRNAQLLANGQQAIARNIESGIFEIDRRLLPS